LKPVDFLVELILGTFLLLVIFHGYLLYIAPQTLLTASAFVRGSLEDLAGDESTCINTQIGTGS
jgi:hypothetical protein